MRALRGLLAMAMAMVAAFTVVSSPATAATTIVTTPVYNWGNPTISTNATYYTDTVTHFDKLKCIRVWTAGSTSWIRVIVNEATVGYENWTTTADINVARSKDSTICTTGSPWRPGGKVAISVYTDASHRLNTGSWAFNS